MNNRRTAPRRSTRLSEALAANSTAQQASGAVAVGKFELICTHFVRDRTPKRAVESIEVRRYTPSVESIPYSRWKSLGYDHKTCDKFVNLQTNIRDLVCKLQSQQSSLTEGRGISLTITPNSHRNRMWARGLNFILPHSHALSEHWKMLYAALMSYSGDYNTMFVGFISVKLNRSVLEILSPALTAQRLTSLYFLGNELRRDELFLVADLVGNIPTLESLAICRNRLGNQEREVVDRLSTAIKQSNLQRLTLSSCGIGNNKTLLSSIRCKGLKRIDLGSNGIASKGAYYIAKFLAKAKNRHVAQCK